MNKFELECRHAVQQYGKLPSDLPHDVWHDLMALWCEEYAVSLGDLVESPVEAAEWTARMARGLRLRGIAMMMQGDDSYYRALIALGINLLTAMDHACHEPVAEILRRQAAELAEERKMEGVR